LQYYSRSDSRFLDRAHRLTIIAKIDYRPKGIIPEGFTVSDKSKRLHWKHPALTKIDKEGKTTIQITDKTVSIGFHQIYGISPHHLVHTCLNRCVQFITYLKELGFKIQNPNYSTVQQHHAIFNKELATFFAKYEIHYISDRLIFDKSIAPNEFELIHPEGGPDDFVKLTDFFEAIVRGKIKIEDLVDIREKLNEIRQSESFSKMNNYIAENTLIAS